MFSVKKQPSVRVTSKTLSLNSDESKKEKPKRELTDIEIRTKNHKYGNYLNRRFSEADHTNKCKAYVATKLKIKPPSPVRTFDDEGNETTKR